jgi:hypothetical protein
MLMIGGSWVWQQLECYCVPTTPQMAVTFAQGSPWPWCLLLDITSRLSRKIDID